MVTNIQPKIYILQYIYIYAYYYAVAVPRHASILYYVLDSRVNHKLLLHFDHSR